MAAKHWITPL